jgi:predicted phage terminase large subunit-like protein
VRATTNPDADSWVAKLLAWWIDPDSGLPLPDRAGKLRWFVRVNDALVWADAPEALRQQYPDLVPKSLAFVPAKLSDNPALMQADPGYLANLLALPLVERERLLGGNWKIRPAAGLVFNRAWFEIVRAAPAQLTKVRAWDKASTSGAGDWSAGVLIGRSLEGLYYVLDVVRGQWSAGERNQVMQQTALSDGPDVAIWVEQEPGSGGKESAEISLRQLAGYAVHAERVTGDKLSRAQAFSAQCEARNVKLVLNPGRDWIGPFLDELHAFPTGAFDDQVDSTSLGFNKLALSAIDPWTVPVDRGSLEPFMHAPPGVFLDQQGDDWETGSDDPFHVEGGNPFDF